MRFIITLATVFLMSAYVNAANVNDQDLSAAEAVVSSYKELRKYCSVARGEDRKECFRDLNEANPAYQQAKSIIDSQKVQDETSLHLVSFVY